MQLIKLKSITANPTELSEGESITGYDSAMWVERYQKPGEFQITAKLSSGLRTFLPIGTFITHQRTLELMRVENHVIKEPQDDDPTIEISGRSFVAYLEERIVDQNQAAVADTVNDYQIASAVSWAQIVTLIDDHLFDTTLVVVDNRVPGMHVEHVCSGTGTSELRHVKYGTVWERVEELLKVDDVGIRMVRPSGTETDSIFQVYQGGDKSANVRFSSFLGDLDNVEYLWSDKKIKNFARVVGRWVQVVTSIGTAVNADRRYMLVDASDIDQQASAMPTGTALTLVKAAMAIRGKEELKKQQRIVITQADVNPNGRYRYGWQYDYELGDLVMVDANYNESQLMRVVEHAEIEDENGTTSHPTLAIPGDTSA